MSLRTVEQPSIAVNPNQLLKNIRPVFEAVQNNFLFASKPARIGDDVNIGTRDNLAHSGRPIRGVLGGQSIARLAQKLPPYYVERHRLGKGKHPPLGTTRRFEHALAHIQILHMLGIGDDLTQRRAILPLSVEICAKGSDRVGALAQNNPVDLKGILVKDFNIRDTIGNAWLSLEDITNKETFDLEQFRGCYAIGGADLSSSRDLTCATLLLIDRETEKRYVAQMYWIPEDSMERRVNEEKLPYDKWYERGLVRLCKGNTINYKDVTAWFVEMANTYGIFPAWIYYDRWSATYWVEEMKATGFTEMKGVAQGAKTLSLPMQFLGADLQAKKINYNNNPVLRWCLSNTGVQEDRNGNIVPIKNQAAKQRIDGTASLLNAYVGLYEHYNEFIEAQ